MAGGFIHQQKVVLVLGIVLLIGMKIFYEGRYTHQYMNSITHMNSNIAETSKEAHQFNSIIKNNDSISTIGTAIGINESKLQTPNMTNIMMEVQKLNSTAVKNNVSVVTSNNATTKSEHKLPAAKMMNIPDHGKVSPACRPHFLVANHPDQPLQWSNFSKFKRLYFFHTRKAGGTSLKYYMEMVAKHHGLKFATHEFEGSEVPGSNSNDEPTFYVTHLREPVSRLLLINTSIQLTFSLTYVLQQVQVSRSISHFKCRCLSILQFGLNHDTNVNLFPVTLANVKMKADGTVIN